MEKNNSELIQIVSRAAEYLCKESQFGRWLDARTDGTCILALSSCGLAITNIKYLQYCVMELLEDVTRDEDGLNWNEEIWDTSICALAMKNATGTQHNALLKEVLEWLLEEISDTKDNFRNEPWETLWALSALLNTFELSQRIKKIAKDCMQWVLEKRNQKGVLISPHYVGLLLTVLSHMIEKFQFDRNENDYYENVIDQNIEYLMQEFNIRAKKGKLWSDEPWSIGLILLGIACACQSNKTFFAKNEFNEFLIKWCNSKWEKWRCWKDVTDTSVMLVGLAEYCISKIVMEENGNSAYRKNLQKQIVEHIDFEFREQKSRRTIVHPLWSGREFKQKSKLCCLLMPYQENWSQQINDTLKKICEEHGYELKLARDMDDREVVEGIWRLINESRIVIADCTGRNVNVFYEVGIAHTIGKDVILICQNAVDDIPIDIRLQRVIEYQTKDFYEYMKRKLPDLIDNIIAGRL